MSGHCIGTHAIDIACELHNVPAGTKCPGDTICPARTAAARNITRLANMKARQP